VALSWRRVKSLDLFPFHHRIPVYLFDEDGLSIEHRIGERVIRTLVQTTRLLPFVRGQEYEFSHIEQIQGLQTLGHLPWISGM
jgi:hypothetical protein